MGTLEEFLIKHICPKCHLGIMAPHGESLEFLRCPICGFTKKDEDERKQ